MAPAIDWTEKYRPRTLADVVGNSKAIEELRAWAATWADGTPEKERAVVLAGEPGVGKTTAAHALARDLGWGVIELNASDQRNEEVIRRIATSGAVNRAFAFDDATGALASGPAGRQLIILDEADNLFGREDRGGMKAITDTIRVAKQPIVLIANDYYELTRRGGSLKTLAKTIKFTKVHSRSIPPAIKRIADAEGIELAPGVPEAIAERAGGDLRSAVNDFAAVAAGREKVTTKDVEALGMRDSVGDVWGLLGKVFYGKNVDEARKAAWDVDETPENIALWIDENLPVMYTDRADLVEGYHWLSRADVYLGRVRRRQQYGLWGYANELMTGGVSVAKQKRPSGARFVFPGWLRKMSSSRAMRELRNKLAEKIGAETHTSRRVTRQDMFPLFQALMERDDEFAAWAIWNFDFDADEVAFLLQTKSTTARVKKLMAAAGERGPKRAKSAVGGAGGLGSFDDGDDDEGGESLISSSGDEDEDEQPAAKPTKAAKAVGGDAAAEEAPAKPGKDEAAAKNKRLFDF